MSDAPERLWMDPSGIDEQDIVCGTINPPKRRGYLNCDVEYVRSDIHDAAQAVALERGEKLFAAQALIAELEAALALRTGADHDEDCKAHRDRACNCGHVEAVRALRSALTKRDGMRHAHDCQIGQGGYCDCGHSDAMRALEAKP